MTTLMRSTSVKRAAFVVSLAGVALLFCNVFAFSADVAEGKKLARRVCSVCHVTSDGQSEGMPAAPSFRSIAKSEHFRDKGAALLLERHKGMPQFALDRQQINDLAAYIRSLGN